MHILIVGAGIAGLTLADQLFAAGNQVVVVEQASHLRSGGYMIDFFGPGFDVAERMGLLGELEALHHPIARLSFRRGDGTERWALDYRWARQRWFRGRHLSLLRRDLVDVLHRRVYRRVPVRFDESVVWLEQTRGEVEVTFSRGGRERYDLVIGADGVRSRVRHLAFLPGEWKRVPLGYHTASFVFEPGAEELRDLRDDVSASLSVVGRRISVHPLRGERLAAFLLYRSSMAVVQPDAGEGPICADVARIYADMRWLVPAVLRAFPGEGLHYDEASQVVMDSWSHGRIGLVGDACGCVSLVGGQGASLAMLGASVLAEELRQSPHDPCRALQRYEQRVRPTVISRQKRGPRVADWFVPRTPTRIAVRDAFMRAAAHRMFVGIARRSLVGG